MADEFNLVPTNNLEKHLDNILRTAQGEEPQYDLAPNWRVEQYLAAIASALASGGGGGGEPLILHTTSTPISGGTRVELDKTAGEIYTALMSGKQIFLGFSTSSATELYPLSMIRFNNGGFVTKLFNKAAINAEFDASTATTKPYYITPGGGND